MYVSYRRWKDLSQEVDGQSEVSFRWVRPWWHADRSEMAVSLSLHHGGCDYYTQASLVGYLPFAAFALVLRNPMLWWVRYWGKTNVNLTYSVKKGKNKDWFMRDIWPVVETIGSFRKGKVNCTYTKTNKTTRLGIPSAELTMQFISQILSNCVLCRLVLEASFTWKGFSY